LEGDLLLSFKHLSLCTSLLAIISIYALGLFILFGDLWVWVFVFPTGLMFLDYFPLDVSMIFLPAFAFFSYLVY